jgi:uncharacterized protein with ParB-like and HNH nuclease domain
MTTEHRQSREVDGKGRTVRELLGGRKYSIDYYQREYKWKSKQVMELIDDLTGKFRESHEEGNERSDLTGKSCTKWNERESTWRKSGSCQSRGTSQSKS